MKVGAEVLEQRLCTPPECKGVGGMARNRLALVTGDTLVVGEPRTA